jgi:hypothetical protein
MLSFTLLAFYSPVILFKRLCGAGASLETIGREKLELEA